VERQIELVHVQPGKPTPQNERIAFPRDQLVKILISTVDFSVCSRAGSRYKSGFDECIGDCVPIDPDNHVFLMASTAQGLSIALYCGGQVQVKSRAAPRGTRRPQAPTAYTSAWCSCCDSAVSDFLDYSKLEQVEPGTRGLSA
jgi:hypothetical protein